MRRQPPKRTPFDPQRRAKAANPGEVAGQTPARTPDAPSGRSADGCVAGPGRRTKIGVEIVLGLPLLAGIDLMAGRVGATARFVTWPVVAFTVVAAAVAMVGLWFGVDRPWLLAAGVPPALMLSYVLPAAPVSVVAGVLVFLAAVAVVVRGIAAGTAMTVGALMVLFVVIQGPAVECRDSSVSSSSGPWWIPAPTESSGSGMGASDGQFSGTTQVGEHHYAYTCAGGQLTRFEPADW